MKSIIFVDRSNLYFYGSNVHAVLAMPFNPKVVSDMEIINGEELEKQLDEFITKNKIEPSETAIILARQSSFEKIVPPNTPQLQIDQEKKKFIENVPFEHIMDQTIKTDKGTKFVAINQELVFLMKAIFEKHHFHIDSIASIAALYPQGDITFNNSSAQTLLRDASAIKQNSFSLEEKKPSEVDMFEEETSGSKKSNKILLLVGVFIILIGILIIMLMMRRSSSTKKPTRTITQTPKVTAAASPTTSVSPSPVPQITEVPKTSLTIRILNGSGISGQAEQIKEALEKEDYTNITTGNAPTVESQRTLIVTKSQISPSQKEELAAIIEDIAGPVTIQENADIDVDILVTTTRNSNP